MFSHVLSLNTDQEIELNRFISGHFYGEIKGLVAAHAQNKIRCDDRAMHAQQYRDISEKELYRRVFTFCTGNTTFFLKQTPWRQRVEEIP